jgi:uncharacterized protein (TIGR02145 family)
VPSELYGNNYDVLGAPCYDVDRSAARADSFATGYGKTYSFAHSRSYSDLQVSYEDPHGLVDHIVQPVNTSNPVAYGKEPFTVVFKSGVKTSVPVSGRDTVKLWISYKDNLGDSKLALRNIRVQDAGCHCPARIDRLSDRWLTFACHNLGGLDITSDSQTLGREHHGDWYRFGATAVSMANTPAHDTSNTWDAPYYQTGNNPWPNEGVPPCPAGWRLPDIDELAGIINVNLTRLGDTEIYSNITPVNNELTYHGGWSEDTSNFFAYMKVGDYLYFPAAGYRESTDASLSKRGNQGRYWSNSPKISQGTVYYMLFSKLFVQLETSDRAYTHSVRCVAAE